MLDTNFQRGILAVIGCVLVQISVGELNLLGFLYPYFIAYFRIYNPGLKEEQMQMLPIYWLVAEVFSCPFGVFVFSKVGFKFTFLIFISYFCAIQWLSSYITNWYFFSILYGLSGGISQGALMVLPIYCCWRYFPISHKSRVSGIVISSYAVSPFFTSVIALWTINPNNERQTLVGGDGRHYFQESVAMNVPYFLRVFAVVCLAIGFLGILFIFDPLMKEEQKDAYQIAMTDKSERQNALKDQNTQENRAEAAENLNEQIQNITYISFNDIKTYFAQEKFLTVYITMILCILVPLMLNFCFKSLALEYLKNDAFVTMIGSVGALVNAASRIIVGLLFEKFGYYKVACFIVLIELTTTLGFIWYVRNKVSYVFAVCGFEASYGSLLGIYPLLSDRLFKKKGAIFYSYLISNMAIGSILSLNIYTFLKEKAGLFVPFLVISLATAAALPLILKIGVYEEKAIANDDDL